MKGQHQEGARFILGQRREGVGNYFSRAAKLIINQDLLFCSSLLFSPTILFPPLLTLFSEKIRGIARAGCYVYTLLEMRGPSYGWFLNFIVLM
jgi:hypothetical protein